MHRWGQSGSVDKTVCKAMAGDEAGLVSPVWHSHATCSSPLSASSASFADIIRDELLQTATFEYTANKSLALIQVNYLGSHCKKMGVKHEVKM